MYLFGFNAFLSHLTMKKAGNVHLTMYKKSELEKEGERDGARAPTMFSRATVCNKDSDKNNDGHKRTVCPSVCVWQRQ